MSTFRMILILCLILANTSTALFAEKTEGTGSSAGGGDTVALEFVRSFNTALEKTEAQDPQLYKKLNPKLLRQTLGQCHILVTEDALRITTNGITQDAVAENIREQNIIRINRSRWQAITERSLKEALALHEVLSLQGIEQTGKYPLSGEYIKSQGISITSFSESIVLRVPDKLSSVATLRVVTSTEFSKRPSKQDLVIMQCREACEQKAKEYDIEFNRLEFNKDLLLRPGTYKISLRAPINWNREDELRINTPSVTVELEAGQYFSLRLTEVYFPKLSGKVTATITPTFSQPEIYQQALRQLKRYFDLADNGGSFELKSYASTNFEEDVNENTLAYLRDGMYLYEACTVVKKNPSAYPAQAAVCNKAITRGELSKEDVLTFRDVRKESETSFSYFDSAIQDSQHCMDRKNITRYLNNHPGTFPFISSYSWEDGAWCTINKFERKNFSPFSLEVDSGSRFLLTPGSYAVRLANESGDMAETSINAKGNEVQTLQP